jgi:ABC-type lipoprotein export system ATPase subunit
VQGENALWLVRFPRVVLAVVVGASLGCAGALMQGVFGNPLAEPGVAGVSAGAAVGAAAIVSGVTLFGAWSTAAAAFAGGILTTLIVYAMSRAADRTEVVTLVLTGVDLHADTGEVVALVGPNGAGKSTLLAALSGDLDFAGRVEIGGREIGSYRTVELARQRSMLPQKATLSFPFEAGEVIRMGRAPWTGRPEAADDEREVAEAMRLTETSGFARRQFPALSGGEQARVALARVLAQRTPVLPRRTT